MGWQRSKARELLPRAATFLGEQGLVILTDGKNAWGLPAKPGRTLMCSDDGRTLFLLCPLKDTRPRRGKDQARRINAQALRAAGLYERFTAREANEFHNCLVPAFRKPYFSGWVVELTYYCDKNPDAFDLGPAEEDDDDLDDDELEDDEELEGVDGGRPQAFVHYFEEPGVAPAYPELWCVGKDQYVIPPGPFRVGARGIEWARAPRRKGEFNGSLSSKEAT